MTPWINALINGAIASLVPAFLLWLVLRLTPRRILNAATRYIVWWVLLVAVLVLPLMYLPPSNPANVNPAAVTSSRQQSDPEEPIAPIESAATHMIVFPSSLATPSSVWLRLPLRVDAGRWLQWALVFWCATSALLLVRLIASFVVLSQRSARAIDVPDSLSEQSAIWRRLCGLRRRNPRVALSDEISIPVAVGFLHPSILLPSRFVDRCSESEIHWIGLHETAHLGRGDDYTLIVQRLIEVLLPWHIVVRFIGRQLDLEREIACDDVVVKTSGSSKPYASCLMRVVEWGGDSVIPAAATVAGRGSQLARRVDALLDRTRYTEPRFRQAMASVLLLVFVMLLWSLGTAPAIVAVTAASTNDPAPRVSLPPKSTTLTSTETNFVVPRHDTAVSGLASEPRNVRSDYSGQWQVDAVPFAPWILDFRVHGDTVAGTVRQNAMDSPGTSKTTFAFPVEISGGRIAGGAIAFKVLSPDGQRVISFAGKLNGDNIEFTRSIEILPGGSAGVEGIFDSMSAHEFAATRVASTRGASRWQIDGVPFGPWTFNLQFNDAHIAGTVTQGGWDATSSYITELNYPMEVSEGIVKGNSIAFSVTPDKDRKIIFEGSIQGDTLVLSKHVHVRPGGDGGRDGLYGSKGLPQFAAHLIR